MKIFSDRLKTERIFNKLTQQQMADKLGIAQNTYGKYEKGVTEPSYENLVKISDILDAPIDYLLGKTDF